MKTTFLCLWLAAGVLPTLAPGAEPPIITKARAWLGTDDALDAVHAIHITGSMTTGVEGDDKSSHSAKLEIVFQKPYEESITTLAPDRLQRRVLDNYNGWLLDQKLNPGDAPVFDPHKPQALTLLGVDEVRMLRADTWENLYFYRGIERADGEMTDLGPATVEGVACEKVQLKHSDTIVYTRYFEQSSGRLVFTETYAGAKIREEGVIEAGGVKFPKRITLTEPLNGKVQQTVVLLDTVTVNEDKPEDFFATPPPPLPIDRPVPSAPAPSAAPSSVQP